MAKKMEGCRASRNKDSFLRGAGEVDWLLLAAADVPRYDIDQAGHRDSMTRIMGMHSRVKKGRSSLAFAPVIG